MEKKNTVIEVDLLHANSTIVEDKPKPNNMEEWNLNYSGKIENPKQEQDITNELTGS